MRILFENYSVELSGPADANSCRLGYIVGKNQRVTISNNSNLDEVYSSSKNGWIVLWAEPIIKAKEAPTGASVCALHSSSKTATKVAIHFFKSIMFGKYLSK